MGNSSINEYGFLWSESVGSKNSISYKMIIGSTNDIISFEAKIDRA